MHIIHFLKIFQHLFKLNASHSPFALYLKVLEGNSLSYHVYALLRYKTYISKGCLYSCRMASFSG